MHTCPATAAESVHLMLDELNKRTTEATVVRKNGTITPLFLLESHPLGLWLLDETK